MGNAFEIAQCITHYDPDGITTGTDSTLGSGEPSFRFRLQSRNPQDKTALIDAFVAVAEEIERLHTECSGASRFPKYNANRTAKNSTATGPILPIATAPRACSRAAQPPDPVQLAQAGEGMTRINEAMATNQQGPVGDHSFVQAPISVPGLDHSMLTDIATLQETVKQHDCRIKRLDQTVTKGFDSVLKNLAEISRKLDSPPSSRGGPPPRRSFGPRRNLTDVTCYACGSKWHYACDCKDTSFSALPAQKQEEVQRAFQHAPIGDFTMAVVWEQYAPNDSSQSLDEALDNLHRWSCGGQKVEKLQKLQTAALTALPQVDTSLLPPSSSFKVTSLASPTFTYSGMPLSGTTSTCSPFSVQDTRPEKGWFVKFPAVPESDVPGSTSKAPSCWVKKRSHGISGRLIARPERRGGYTEHPIRLTQRLRNASCFRPLAGESYKIEDPLKCSRTFRKTQPKPSRWSSHLNFGEEEVAQDDASQDSRDKQENPLAERIQNPLKSVPVRNPDNISSLCPLLFASTLPSSSSIPSRVRTVHRKLMAVFRPYRLPGYSLPRGRTALTELNARLAFAPPLPAVPNQPRKPARLWLHPNGQQLHLQPGGHWHSGPAAPAQSTNFPWASLLNPKQWAANFPSIGRGYSSCTCSCREGKSE